MATASTSSAGTARLASPSSAASTPVIESPVNSHSLVRRIPRCTGHMPNTWISPIVRASGWPNVASSAQNTMSSTPARSSPPATHAPRTTPIVAWRMRHSRIQRSRDSWNSRREKIGLRRCGRASSGRDGSPVPQR